MSLLSECPPLVPPEEGYTTDRIFDIPSQTEQMRLFLNKVFALHNSTRRGDCHILGIRYYVEFDDGSVMPTGLLEPSFLPSVYVIFFPGRPFSSDDCTKIHKVLVNVSWKRKYLHELRGKPR